MFKTAISAMMVAMVSMSALEAEAHYFIVGGKAKYCSHCIDAEVEHDHQVPLGGHLEEIENRVRTQEVEILCKDGTEVLSVTPMNLFAKRLLEDGDITTLVDDKGNTLLTTAELETRVSDAALRFDTVPCGDRPREVLTRKMDVKIISRQCTSAPCNEVNTFTATCTLPKRFNLKDYPKNLPPIGTLYDCPNPVIAPQID